MSPRRQAYRDDAGRWRLVRFDDDTPTVVRVLDRIEADVNAGSRMPPAPKALAAILDSARRDDGRPTDAMLRRLHVLARQAALDRDDRLELTEVLLRRDCSSWNDLSQADAVALTHALEGFAYICHLQARAGRRWREARRTEGTPTP